MPQIPHICICICTYKRPKFLKALLLALEKQVTHGLFDYSIVVVDNDRAESARQTVELYGQQTTISISYYVEPEQNIALARNRAVANASGNLVAFIDDDEVPIDEWLVRMHETLSKFDADGVLGPVIPFFAVAPPEWMVKAGLFERPNSSNTNLVIKWTQTGTGNVLIRRSILDEVPGPFGREFGSGGEDQDFFRREMSLGKVFVWCEDAIVHETIPAERTRLSFHLRRALLRGKISFSNPSGRVIGILKSLAACGFYTILLPFLLLGGRHLFVRYLVKDFDHIGKILA
jgi:succinoglycan biosynthesis protein ExoM